MIDIRRSEQRGHTKIDWLDSRHTFSFSDYFDPQHLHFRSLRVINEDRVAPGAGFPMHPHRDMEILTYLLQGALQHRDSMGHGSVIRPGQIQKMSAGTGVTHSEFNPSPTEATHLLQIWILPERKGLKPAYEEHTFAGGELEGKFAHLAGPQAAVSIRQDAHLYAAKLESGKETEYKLDPKRYAWVQVARGELKLNGQTLRAGDGVAVAKESFLKFAAQRPSEVLLFDLA